MFSWLIKNKSYCPLNVLLVVRKHSSPRKLYRDFVTYGSKPGKSFLSTLNPWWSVFDIGSSLQGIDDHAYSWRSSFPLHWRGPCVSETQSHLKRPILSSLSSLFFVFCFVLPSTKEDQEKCEKLDPRFLCKVRNTKEPSWSGVCVCVCACTLSCVWLFVTPGTIACQSPLSMEFPRQEHWSWLLLPFPGDLPNPRIEPLHLLHW